MSDYVYLKNLNGQQIKPVTDLAAINMTTTNGIGVSTVNGGTIGIIDGYIESAYYTEMADPAVGAANVSSAYVDGGTAVAILGAYTVASAVDTAAPSQQKVPSEKAVVDALNNVVVSGVSYYAGTGIDINAGHTVSVANVPQSSVAGLETTLTGINTAVAAKQDAISAGYRMSLDGTTLNQKRYFDIESPTSATITLQAGHAYKITATNSSKTLDSEQIPANQFGLEGHAEIFVAGTGLIKTTSNVVLAQALEPDAVNNCTVRFHDGKAIISVEDRVAGYIVISASGTTAGTLPYALSTASNEYISFDASLNNMTLDLAGVTTSAGEKHIVGNGYTETIVSGGINCTSKTTFSNLGMNGVVVSSGTLTMGDVYIPNGSTVSVSGGGLAVEKVTGAGSDSVINLGKTNVVVSSGGTAHASGCTFMNGSGIYFEGNNRAGAVLVNNGGSALIEGCVFSGNSAAFYPAIYGKGTTSVTSSLFTNNYGIGTIGARAGLYLSSVTIDNNSGPWDLDVINCNIQDCEISPSQDKSILVSNTLTMLGGNNVGGISLTGGKVVITGSNTIRNIVSSSGATGSVTISSGASINLTSSINPGGGVTFEQGGATIIPGGSSAIAYTLGGLTVPKIGNTNVIGLSSSYAYVSSNTSAVASNAIFSGGYASNANGGAVVMGPSASFSAFDCVFDKNSGYNAGGMIAPAEGCTLVLSGCTVTDNFAYNGGGVFLFSGASGELVSCTMSGNKGYTAGALHVNAGASVSLSGCTITGNIASSAFGGGLNAYGNANISACTISGNSQGDIRIASNTVLIKDSTVGLIATSGGTVTFEGTNTLASAGGGTGTVIISGGASITLTSSIAPGGGVIVDGGCQIITSAGTTVSIAGGTYTKINNDGTTVPPQA